MSTTHQGFANYPTFLVAAYVDNDARSYGERCQLIAESIKRGDSVHETADSLEEWITNSAPSMGGTLWSDLLTSALAEVNWRELAAMWIAEHRESHPDDAGDASTAEE